MDWADGRLAHGLYGLLPPRLDIGRLPKFITCSHQFNNSLILLTLCHVLLSNGRQLAVQKLPLHFRLFQIDSLCLIFRRPITKAAADFLNLCKLVLRFHVIFPFLLIIHSTASFIGSRLELLLHSWP